MWMEMASLTWWLLMQLLVLILYRYCAILPLQAVSSSFAAKVDFTTGAIPRSVAIGDVDGDGKPDLVVANSATSPASTTISVLRNTSTSGSIDASSFAAKVDFTAGTAPRYVAIGDVDGDGKPDLVVANINSNNISVLRNTSTSGSIDASSFAAKVDFATATVLFLLPSLIWMEMEFLKLQQLMVVQAQFRFFK